MWYYCNSFKIWKSLILFFYFSCGLIGDSTKWNEYAEWLIHHSIKCSLNWSAILILNESVIRLTATTSITSNMETPCPNRSSNKHTIPSFIRRMLFVMLFRVPFSSFKSYFYEGWFMQLTLVFPFNLPYPDGPWFVFIRYSRFFLFQPKL